MDDFLFAQEDPKPQSETRQFEVLSTAHNIHLEDAEAKPASPIAN